MAPLPIVEGHVLDGPLLDLVREVLGLVGVEVDI